MAIRDKDRLRLRRALARRFGWRCWYCGARLSPDGGQIDHIVPQCAGGSDQERNLALCCEFCNRAKFVHQLDTFMSWIEWIRSGNSFTPFNMTAEEVANAGSKAKGGYVDLPKLREAL